MTKSNPQSGQQPAFDRDILIERVADIYGRHAPGFRGPKHDLDTLDGLDTTIGRFLIHRRGGHGPLSDFTCAAILSPLQPRERYFICKEIEELLAEFGLESIDNYALRSVLYEPIERIVKPDRIVQPRIKAEGE